ncbi:MAG: phosphatidylglycerophosphatase A [Pseudomonadota bacterium]
MRRFFTGLIIFLSTGAFTGYVPVMPGTAGSIAGLGLYFLFSSCTVRVYIVLTIFVTGIAIWSAGKAALIFKKNDPPAVVIDEIAGILVTLTTFAPDWKYVVPGFILFRCMDIVKPYPANWINDNVHGGPGIVLDDIVAGIYANLALQTLRVLT